MSNTTLTDVCFENFALHPQLLKGLEESGFIRCTPIQAMTLPLTLEGRDVAGQAQTGTGKTAAFLVALFNRLLTRDAHAERRAEAPRAVILAPTRELAVQIDKDAVQVGRHTGLRTALIYGGVDYDKQRRQLEDGVDVIIATPGRLIDFVKQHTVSFRAIEVFDVRPVQVEVLGRGQAPLRLELSGAGSARTVTLPLTGGDGPALEIRTRAVQPDWKQLVFDGRLTTAG